MVHRDFKPDNVLVGDDGRVRVTDFGLVTVSSGKPPEDVRDLELTKTGTVMGTPRYMAPEQHLGEEVDPRTDQFAFCVALYEALFKQPPFAGETYGALADNVLAGDVLPPPSSGVPSRIRAAILRGLSRKPEDRFPSMNALLAELAPQPPRRRWIMLAAAVLVLVAAAVFVIVRRRHETVEDIFYRAQAAYERGDFAAAAAGFRHAFELDPEIDSRGPSYLYNMAAAYERLGNCAEAVRGYRQYLALRKEIPDREQVEAHLRKLNDCKAVDDSAKGALQEGEAAYDRGDYPAAIAAFKRAFALDPNFDKSSAAYLYNLAQSYRQMKDCPNAAATYKKFLVVSDDLPADKRAHIEQLIKELDECTAQEAAGSATR
jgi:tetratricopeptide (TPR) repeat protein